jgi:hypothetical protein
MSQRAPRTSSLPEEPRAIEQRAGQSRSLISPVPHAPAGLRGNTWETEHSA